jgi:tripartite-type tricarboxylate transporter receptor subunit TctC
MGILGIEICDAELLQWAHEPTVTAQSAAESALGKSMLNVALYLTRAAIASCSLVLLMPVNAQQKIDTIKIIVGYPPGGASDRAARLVGDALREKFGATVVVENKTGAGGRVAAQGFRATPANETALMIGNPAVNVVAPHVFKNVGYDPQKDFVPVAQVSRYEFGVAVGPAVPVKEMSHLLAWLRANPDKANFGVPATGSLPHFFALMLGDAAKVKPEVVGYRGSAPLLTDLIGGQLPVAVDTLDTLLPQHEGGKIRVLAIGGAKRAPELPNVPTLKEAGLDVVADGWNAFFAPASMPTARVRELGSAIESIMQSKEMQKKFRDANMEPVAAGPEATAKMIATYRAKWEPVVKAANIQQ